VACSRLRKNRLRELLKRGEPTVGTRILSTWPGTMEVIGHTGTVDYVEFTAEYAPYDLYALDELARASELFDMSTMIKVDAEPRTFVAQRAIGSGIQNVLFADIRTVEDAKEAVRAVRAEPKGWNGCSMRRNVGYLLECGSPEFVQSCDDVVVAFMIEKKSTIENLESILSVDGVDMVQFGPCDYSMSANIPGQFAHPEVKKAEMKSIETALSVGIHPRVEIDYLNEAGPYIDMGVRDFNIGIDVVILHQWLKQNCGLLRETVSKAHH
jgi:2-keto-3-deoxy-L-rhamnonate aldolase RhmA